MELGITGPRSLLQADGQHAITGRELRHRYPQSEPKHTAALNLVTDIAARCTKPSSEELTALLQTKRTRLARPRSERRIATAGTLHCNAWLATDTDLSGMWGWRQEWTPPKHTLVALWADNTLRKRPREGPAEQPHNESGNNLPPRIHIQEQRRCRETDGSLRGWQVMSKAQ